MDIKLKNYNQNDIDFYLPKIFSSDEKIKYILQTNNLSFMQCLNFLKQNSSLSPNSHWQYKFSRKAYSRR
jgi:hypothetical protein